MNNVGFGYGVRGLSNLAALGDTENKRRWAEYERGQKESAAQSQAIGGLVGSVMGLGKGAYKSYEAGEQQADVRNAEAARSQFPDDKSYQESIKKNYSPEVRRELAVRAAIPQDLREAYGLEEPTPQWAYDMAQHTLKLRHLFEE